MLVLDDGADAEMDQAGTRGGVIISARVSTVRTILSIVCVSHLNLWRESEIDNVHYSRSTMKKSSIVVVMGFT